MSRVFSVIVAVCLVVAMAILGAQLANPLVKFKTWDRVETVKGLSDRAYPADHVILPIQFTEASNDLGALYTPVGSHSNTVKQFLLNAVLLKMEFLSVSQKSLISLHSSMAATITPSSATALFRR